MLPLGQRAPWQEGTCQRLPQEGHARLSWPAPLSSMAPRYLAFTVLGLSTVTGLSHSVAWPAWWPVSPTDWRALPSRDHLVYLRSYSFQHHESMFLKINHWLDELQSKGSIWSVNTKQKVNFTKLSRLRGGVWHGLASVLPRTTLVFALCVTMAPLSVHLAMVTRSTPAMQGTQHGLPGWVPEATPPSVASVLAAGKSREPQTGIARAILNFLVVTLAKIGES